MAARDSAAFSTFVDDYFDSLFTWKPARATASGIHDYDHVLEDRSRRACRNRIAILGELQERIRGLRGAHLGVEEDLDLDILEGRIAAELLDLESLQTWRHSPVDYMRIAARAIDGLMRRDFAPPLVRLAAVTSRLRATPQIFEAMKNNVEDPPKESTELAIRIASGSVDFFGETIAAWARDAADGDTAALQEFHRVQRAAFSAIESASRWLRESCSFGPQGTMRSVNRPSVPNCGTKK